MFSARRLARTAGLALATLLAVSALAACGGGGAKITVTDAWARSSPMVAGAGAAYMKIENAGTEADALVGAASPVAATVEVHETYETGMESPAPSDGTGGGMMGMRPIDRLEIPAGEAVELKPGGYHIMLIGLPQELKAGDTIEITPKFEKAGKITVTAEVRES
jgi:hypothetical protein